MMRLPEKIRRTLERIVKEMRVKENVYGVGLFGSWSRGDATPSSDIDLLTLDDGSSNYEYTKRIEIRGLLIDLDHIPKRWIQGPIPPEIDQKLYETQILYDRDWSLTNAKLLMVKSYGSLERVEIRTKMHIVDSDVYLSRATSAYSREDYQSAQVFAVKAFESILRVLMEVALEPFSNSRFIVKLEEVTQKLGMHDIFDEFLETAGLNKSSSVEAERKLKLFKNVWDEISITAKQNSSELEKSHFKVKTKMKYYLNPAFLQGLILRTRFLIENEKTIEAAHYLNNVSLDIIENYAWLKSSINNVKIDHTTLIRCLKNLEEKNPQNYEDIIQLLNLHDVDEKNAARTIEKTRKTILNVRKKRKTLIQSTIPFPKNRGVSNL
ncbi:nucleotidyltransferase domain-containing protein [Candidatus Bathyarchaeota archaeon]|nr:nucleotidyltransferase domain-containing protein [Candidatus Bathyarchaeota archaeon]